MEKFVTDKDILDLLFSDDKIVNTRLRSDKYITKDVYQYIMSRTSFLPHNYNMTMRLHAIKLGWKEHALCKGCGILPVKFTRGRFTTYCGYKCSNIITSNRISLEKYIKGENNPVYRNIDTFIKEFGEGKSIMEICKTHNMNYKGARKTLENLGVSCPGQFDSKISIGQKEIYDFLKEKGENAILSFSGGKEIDIYLKQYNIGIEYNGIYWHSDNLRDKKHLIEKSKYFNERGIEILHFWDIEWHHKKGICKSIILSRIGKHERKEQARKCKIVPIRTKMYMDFLELNHIQGSRNSSIKLGLFYDDELLSVMGFNKMSGNKYEMTRFCNKLGVTVIGGPAKLFKYALENYDEMIDIVSYSDQRLFNGKLYDTLGFKLKHISRPNYFYFKSNDSTLKSRVMFQKHKLKNKLKIFDENLSESENMKENGYYRVWDCGNKVWIYSKK